MSKKIFSLIGAFYCTLFMTTQAVIHSGTCGKDIQWTLDTGTKTLCLEGSGEMNDYSSSGSPWWSYHTLIDTVRISDNITSIGNTAFSYCENLQFVTMGNSVSTIGKQSFQYCSALNTITVPSSLGTIGSGAFEGCKQLKIIHYTGTINGWCQKSWHPNQISNSGYSLFIGEEVKDIDPDLLSGVTKIGDYAFANCVSLKSVVLPSAVQSIGSNAFFNCANLISVTISGASTSIEENAFKYCRALTTINIPTALQEIKEGVFYECQSLEAITIPNSVISIGDWAFKNCSALKTVSISASVSSIGNYSFGDCNNLEAFNVDASNAVYCDENGVLFNKSKTKLLQYPIGKNAADYRVPNSVIIINDGAFSYNKYLNSITLSNAVSTIGDAAFAWCSALANITLPETVMSIGSSAFRDCSSLTTISIPNSTTKIGEMAFERCTALESVHLPSSIASIDYGTFSNCTNLLSIDIPHSVTTINDNAFMYCSGLITLSIPSLVTTIGNSTFAYCTALTSIQCEAQIPPKCGSGAFDGVDKNRPLYVPAGTQEEYGKEFGWMDFSDIKPIQAAETEVIEPHAKPTENTVTLEWTKADGAAVYTIEIKKNDELICTLEFNADGQLKTISFAAPSRNGKGRQTPAALQTSTGWQYTVTDLDPDTDYTYIVTAKRSDESVVYTSTVPFKTQQTATALDQITNDKCQMTSKILRDGQVLILRGDRTYTLTGQEVK